jgi:tetratricopeptide (TPR) repeat protein
MDVRPENLVERAKERFELQDYYGCVHLLDEVIRNGRAFADAHHLLGLALHLSGRSERALEAFDKALELNPRYHEAHIHRGIVLNELGRMSEAEEAFKGAAEARGAERDGIPGHHAAKLANHHAHLGEAYAEVGAMAEAIDQYRTALRLGPTFHDLRYRLARMLLEVGRSLEALEELETLAAAKPGAKDVQSTLGLACYVSGETGRAEEIWTALLEQNPDDSRVRAYLAMLKRAHDKS